MSLHDTILSCYFLTLRRWVVFSLFIILFYMHVTYENYCNIYIFYAAELGDYDPRRHTPGYVSEFRLLAHQTPELEARAVEIHRTLT